jgi:serine/threonine protein kinase
LGMFSEMIWQPGQQLQKGKYTIQAMLDVGHLSVTYLAETSNKQRVVIKAPNDEAMQQEDFERLQQVFVQEAFKLAKCQHPHIVQAEEPFQENGIWCIPMEYIAGFTLDKRDRPILPEAEALKYIWQIGDALGVVHQEELLHRNIHPTNIIIRTRDGEAEAVLIDFGLARKFDQDFTQTRSEEITPGYTPLELYSSQTDRGAYSDLYSLGATLYNLLTGYEPPKADERKLNETPLHFPEHIRPPVKAAIESAMQLKAADRPQTVAAWLEQLPHPSPTPSQPQETPSPKKQEESWEQRINLLQAIAAVLAGLAGLAALVTALQQLFTPPEPPPANPSALSSQQAQQTQQTQQTSANR